MEKTTLFPQLRFRSFSKPWVEVTLKDAFTNFRKKGDSSLPIYSVSQSLGMVPREALERTIQQDAKPEQNLRVEAGDIAYNMMRMWQGAFGISKTVCMISPAYVVLRPTRQVSSLFFKYQFGRRRSLYLFGAYSHGLTKDRLRLYFDDFGTIKAVIPDFKEQQKIASFLSSVDERIELLERKKEKLEVYKKGVMQQIFPSAGSTLSSSKCSGQAPKIRFRQDDGAEFSDWEERKLGDLGEFYGGGTPTSSKKNYWTGDIPWISSSDIGENSIYEISISRYISEEAISKSATKKVPPNSVLIITRVGVGKIAFSKESVCTSQDFTNITPILEVDPVFLAYSLFSKSAKIKNLGQGTSIKGITTDEIKNLKIHCTVREEQEKIVAFLTAIDTSLTTLTQNIFHLQKWKKGLLQQMFV